MLKAVLTLCLSLLLFSICFGQQSDNNQGKVVFKANTELSMELETNVNSEKSKVGDDVNFVLTADVQGDGDKIPKGSTIYSRIVNIEKVGPKNDTAKICIMFDFVKKGDDFLTLVGTIVSIEPNTEDIKLSASKTFSDGTVLSLKGKEIQLDKGRIFKVKLTKDITK